MKKCLIILFSLIIAAGCNNKNSTDTNNQAAQNKTTLLMYIAGTEYDTPDKSTTYFKDEYDNGIKQEALGYGPANYMIKSMIENINPENTNIIIQTGSKENNMKWTDSQISAAGADPEKFYIKDWYNAARWQITDKGIKQIKNLGNVCLDNNSTECVDISSSNTISDFLTYGVKNYPADRYIVIFFSHGGGTINGIIGNTTILDMQSAFQKTKEETNVKFDIIGFAACLMGTAEWMHYLSDYSKYYAASEEKEYSFPWLLDNITKDIAENKTTEQILDTITSTYYMYTADNGSEITNISAVDLSKIKNLGNSIDILSSKIQADFDSNPAKTYNNFFVSLLRSDSYSYGNAGMFDMQSFINNLNDTSWYGIDYSEYGKNITDIISDAVLYNKTTPFLPESYGISFYAPYYSQINDQNFVENNVSIYKKLAGEFSPKYADLIDNLTKYTKTTSTYSLGKIKKAGSKVSIDFTSNFAPTYNSTLELSRKYSDGTVRTATVAGNYSIEAVPVENSDEYKYTITIDTGYEEINDANFFAVAPYGTDKYNPVRVKLINSVDNSKVPYTTIKVPLVLIREGAKYNLIATIIYSFVDNNFGIAGINYQTDIDPSSINGSFSFKKGDIVQIADETGSVADQPDSSLPSYQIQCESEKCIEFNIIHFSAVSAPEYRFRIENIKGERFFSAGSTLE